MQTNSTTRDEHLDFCKKRALAYCDAGDVSGALESMGSDLDKHPETAGHSAIQIGLMLMLIGGLNTPDKMREFINGFN